MWRVSCCHPREKRHYSYKSQPDHWSAAPVGIMFRLSQSRDRGNTTFQTRRITGKRLRNLPSPARRIAQRSTTLERIKNGGIFLGGLCHCAALHSGFCFCGTFCNSRMERSAMTARSLAARWAQHSPKYPVCGLENRKFSITILLRVFSSFDEEGRFTILMEIRHCDSIRTN